MVPLTKGECFWIGMDLARQAAPVSLSVAVALQSGAVMDALSGERWDSDAARSVIVRDTERVDGIRRPDGMFHALSRETGRPSDATSVRFLARIASLNDRTQPLHDGPWEVTVQLVDYSQFTAECGVPAPDPPDPSAGYKGWLLP